MPQMLNGCGTWYYGKANVQRYTGVCGSCKKQATLTTYDTRLFVVAFLIPIIPLGRRHIVEQCAACRRHRVMRWDEWERTQQRANEAVAAYQRAPRDPALAEAAIKASAGFRDLPAFLVLAADVEPNLAGDPKVLSMVAAGYDVFGRLPDVERVLRAALSLRSEDDGLSEALAHCLLRQGRPQDAQPFLEHIVVKGVPGRADLLYHLAQAYQVQGQHEKALAVFDQCAALNPAMQQDATFARLRQASEKKLGTATPVMPAKLVRQAKAAESGRRLAWVAALVAFLAVTGYLLLAWVQGLHRTVYLANGLNTPCTVLVNGARRQVAPQQAVPITIPEGDVRIEIQGGGNVAPPETLSIRTGFWTRPISNTTFVINPDHTALIWRTHVTYAANNSVPNTATLVPPAPLLAFDGITDPFVAPPPTQQVTAGATATRDGLTFRASTKLTPAIRLAAAAKDLGADTVIALAQRHLLLEPARVEYLPLLWSLMKPADLAAFLKPGLGRRPVELEWHRSYQDAMSGTGQVGAAEHEYDAMLAKEPDNAGLQYLAGRICTNTTRGDELTRRASMGDHPCPWALFSLSYRALGNAQFHEAAVQGQRAAALLPDQQEPRQYYRKALLADGQLAKLVVVARGQEDGDVNQALGAYRDEIYAEGQMGQADPARDALRRMKEYLKPFKADSAAAQFRLVEAQAQYCAGSATRYARALGVQSATSARVAAAVCAADFAAADEALAKPDTPSLAAVEHLWVYLAAMRSGKADVAEKHLKAAVDILAKGAQAERPFARALGGTGAVSRQRVDDLINLGLPPDHKLVLLTALGLHNPAARAARFAMARRLDYDKRFPHLLIQQVLEEGAAASPATNPSGG